MGICKSSKAIKFNIVRCKIDRFDTHNITRLLEYDSLEWVFESLWVVLVLLSVATLHRSHCWILRERKNVHFFLFNFYDWIWLLAYQAITTTLLNRIKHFNYCMWIWILHTTISALLTWNVELLSLSKNIPNHFA